MCSGCVHKEYPDRVGYGRYSTISFFLKYELFGEMLAGSRPFIWM